MKKIVLIGCVSQKRNEKSKAKDLYDKSLLFRNSLAYAKKLNPDKIYILSALYGLIDLEAEIEPYNVTLSYVSKESKNKNPNLKKLSKDEIKIWGENIIKELSKVSNVNNDNYIILAGENYIKPIENSLANSETPLRGLRIGERNKFLKEHISKVLVK